MFVFIPYWYRKFTVENDSLAIATRDLLKINYLEAVSISELLNISTINEIMIHFRHNRNLKEYFGIFNRQEVQHLMREKGMTEERIENFASLIILLAKESVYIPKAIFDIARTRTLEALEFDNFENLPEGCLSAVIACVANQHHHLRTMSFQYYMSLK